MSAPMHAGFIGFIFTDARGEMLSSRWLCFVEIRQYYIYECRDARAYILPVKITAITDAMKLPHSMMVCYVRDDFNAR